ncbi:MAG: hypothetical protein IKE51_03310 [Solobacterium sp.]|nr:hypothetical protein [Solobacterium sp.]
MKVGVFYLVSSTASGELANQQNYPWLESLSKKIDVDFEVSDIEHIKDYELPLIFVGSGGTEAVFLENLDKLPRPIYLLTTGANNSLAASMEILSYMRQNDIPGEIIHGTDDYVSKKIKDISIVNQARKRLSNFRFARVGKPSDWLISSEVDATLSKQLNGIEIIDITMEEFLEEINKKEYVENEYTKRIQEKEFDSKEFKEAFYIYGALRRLVDKYQLDGVTVRCFDLLDRVHSTGCAALAILNSEGIYAACEGDVPSLLSMAILGELTSQPVFMANPSRIDTDKNEIIFAHCTLPISMPTDFEVMTHFESQIGVAFRGKIPEGPITVFKCDGLMEEYFVTQGELLENLCEYNLCRTQIKLHLDKSVEYFLKDSIGNHHLIITGNHEQLINEFFGW